MYHTRHRLGDLNFLFLLYILLSCTVTVTESFSALETPSRKITSNSYSSKVFMRATSSVTRLFSRLGRSSTSIYNTTKNPLSLRSLSLSNSQGVKGQQYQYSYCKSPRLCATVSTTSSSKETEPESDLYTEPDPEKLSKLMPDHDDDGRPYTAYEKCVRRLYLTNLFHPVKLGLQNMEMLHEALGNPMDQPDVTVVHVAGTNGKGSVSLKIAKALEAAGHKVGLFVSPHVASFRERMQVNGELITETEVEEFIPLIYDICQDKKIPATFFEVTTGLAFKFFASRKVDVVVLETGLGGRLDATNVVKRPDICVITSIGLEHTHILGDTIELIAKEKAGIIKRDSPVLVGPNCPHDVIRQCANEKESGGYYTCDDILSPSPMMSNTDDSETEGKMVDYDVENSRIVEAALKVLETRGTTTKLNLPMPQDVLRRALAIRPPCRFEEKIVTGKTGKEIKVILDVAHNPAAMEHLVQKLADSYPDRPVRIVAGFSRDKDLAVCGNTLLSYVSDPKQIHLVEAAHPRAAKLEDMLEAEPLLRESNFEESDRSITTQVKLAIDAAEEDDIVVICGSVFLMAEAREAIGIDEPRDSKYIAEVAGANLRHGQENFADKVVESNN